MSEEQDSFTAVTVLVNRMKTNPEDFTGVEGRLTNFSALLMRHIHHKPVDEFWIFTPEEVQLLIDAYRNHIARPAFQKELFDVIFSDKPARRLGSPMTSPTGKSEYEHIYNEQAYQEHKARMQEEAARAMSQIRGTGAISTWGGVTPTSCSTFFGGKR